MANYATNLKTWGATGVEHPDGYNYLEGEQPVDDWDNFLRHNSIEDLKYLISLTNSRIETDKGTSHPTSPENAHLSYRLDEERLSHYDNTASSWHGLVKVDGDTMQGALDMGGYALSGIGALTLDGNGDVSGNDLNDSVGGTNIYDGTNAHVPLSVLEQSEITVNAGSHLSGTETISLGGSVTINVDDDFLLNDGDVSTGELRGQRAEGSRLFTAENTTSGDRLTVRSNTSSEFELVGYDSSAGTWNYGSALSYDPGGEDWSFGTLPNVDGDLIATETWANANLVNVEDTEITQQDGGSVGYNTFVPVGTFGLDDGEQLYVTRATLTKNGFDEACVSNVNLTIAVSNGDTVQILSGDGATIYDDEEGDPITQYTNSTGGHVSVAIGIDNGHFGTGFGDDTSAYAGFSVRKY